MIALDRPDGDVKLRCRKIGTKPVSRMRKKSILLLLLTILILSCFYFVYFYGWLEFRKNRDTPERFLNHMVVSKKKYADDSTKIQKELRFFLINHQKTFYSKEYYDFTRIYIDSIFYSPDLNKIAVFVIAENPTSRREIPDERYKWHYNGFCYFGTRDKDSIDLISLGGGYGSYKKQKVIEALKENYFRLFATIKSSNGQYRYNYNLNDIRFWNGPIWKEIDGIKKKKEMFEKEKREHPENVYEPN